MVGGHMKFNLMNIVASITAVLALIGGIIAFDSRYTKQNDLLQIKDEIVEEMRREVTKNRAVMIAGMQRDADDIEFQMIEIEESGEKVPRFLKEKHKQITRQIEDLKAVDTDKD
jgi:hypothetical protein